MIPALIFAISLLTLLQFFVSYCHALIAQSRGHKLSDQVCEISGIAANPVRGDHFERLLELIALCPDPGGDTNRIFAVSNYFKLLGLGRALLGWAVPAGARWMEKERGGCAYVAAVVLDRRIAYTRMLTTQQACSQL